MEIRKLERADFEAWDNFCASTSGAWFWHTSAFLLYQQAYRPSLETQPEHFYLLRDRRVIAICPLAVETISTGGKIVRVLSLGGDRIPAPVVADNLFSSDRMRVFRTVLEKVDQVAAEHGAFRVAFRQAVLSPKCLTPDVAPANELVQFGYFDLPLQTQIIDLRRPLAELWSDLRKSYHSPIRRVEENFRFELYDASNITQEIFDTYRLLHHQAAGRVTRPLETFQMMLEWIRQGAALLTRICRGQDVVACALIMTYKNFAYYGSSCEDAALGSEWALGHFLQWKVFEALKARGITHYELGWQLYAPQIAYLSTPDEQKIAFFKRGFGGFSVPIFCAEKFYSPEFFAEDYGRRIHRLVEGLRKANAVQSLESSDPGASRT